MSPYMTFMMVEKFHSKLVIIASVFPYYKDNVKTAGHMLFTQYFDAFLYHIAYNYW
jgi:hypothetical protein